MRGGQRVPLARPRQHELERHVGHVVRRAVGVAGRHLLGEEALAVDRLAARDLLGAGDPRVADVDHARVGEVQRHPERDREQARDDQEHPRRARPQARLAAAAEPHPQHAPEEVEERRVDERRADADLARVEEDLAHPEAEEHEQVEVGDPKRLSPVEKAEEEDERERDPHPRRVQRVAELALVAARHRPRDLHPRPRLDRPRRVPPSTWTWTTSSSSWRRSRPASARRRAPPRASRAARARP